MKDSYRPAWWLPGPHLQTLWGRFFRPARAPLHQHERWDTPDGDVLDVYRAHARHATVHLVLLHGLEGGVRSHYARGILAGAAERGWSTTLVAFRSCGPELNRLPRFYHSADTADARLVIERARAAEPEVALVAAGVSMGGNVLLRLLAEDAAWAEEQIAGAAAISVPFDLARSSRRIDAGFSRVYQRHFVRSLRRKVLAKIARGQQLTIAGEIAGVRTMYDFDDRVTAPLHGYDGAEDYYRRASSLPVLDRIRVPTLLVSAENDPFLPAVVLDEVRRKANGNSALHTLFVPAGGHVGFVAGTPWRQIYWGEARALDFLAGRADAWKQRPLAATTMGGPS